MSQDFANKTSKVHEDATTILFVSFEEFGLPDVVTMWRLGVERVLKEVGAKLIYVICISLNLSCSLSSSSFFFRARPEKFVAGGVRRIHLQGVLEEYTTSDDDCGLVKPL